MSETPKKSVYELPKMVTDNPQGNFEVMLNLVYAKDGWSYIRYGDEDMQITDFCFKELCPKFGCPEFADQTMTSEEQDEFLSDCVFDGCPVATVYAALSGYGHLRDRLRKHEDAMTNRVLTLEEVDAHCEGGADAVPLWVEFDGGTNGWVLIAPARETCKMDFVSKYLAMMGILYEKEWRCWLRKPTETERRGTPWEK